MLSLSNGGTLSVGYDPTTSQVVYHAHVPQNTYLAIGYGTSMFGTDFVSWSAGINTALSQC